MILLGDSDTVMLTICHKLLLSNTRLEVESYASEFSSIPLHRQATPICTYCGLWDQPNRSHSLSISSCISTCHFRRDMLALCFKLPKLLISGSCIIVLLLVVQLSVH